MTRDFAQVSATTFGVHRASCETCKEQDAHDPDRAKLCVEGRGWLANVDDYNGSAAAGEQIKV